ncbi:hypothetical protein H0R92_03430 [Treponema sp. OMZ 840]|uniref:hypothetical protein n=1 Tax=Treponema sp. OMZ 840 TaxID=244313 RepID=UPI003D9254D8
MKKFFITALSICTLYTAFAYNIEHIDVSKIKNVEKYTAEIRFLQENTKFLSGYIPDEHWKAPLSKTEYIKKLKKIRITFSKYPEKDNAEYLLLKALVSEYLYHLHDTDSYEDTVQGYNAAGKLKDADYRYKWFLGTFYARAAQPFKSIKEFEYIFERIPRERLHPACIGDYAYAEMLALMPKRAIADFTYYHSVIGGGAEKNRALQSLMENFIDYTGKHDIKADDVFSFSEREEGSGVFSRLLGLWIPVAPDDTCQFLDLTDGKAAVLISVPSVLPEYAGTTYTILVLSFLSDFDGPADILEKLPALKEINLGFPQSYKTYEYSNPRQYPEKGGAYGLAAVVRAPYEAGLETEIERPVTIRNTDNAPGPQYFALQKEFNRYKGELVHLILLDSCIAFYDESVQKYTDLLKTVNIK